MTLLRCMHLPAVAGCALLLAVCLVVLPQAETAYRVVLESYSNSPKLVRLYAKFKEGIKNDPWGAAE